MALATVLLTGAAGGIGSHLRAPLRERAAELRITDVAPLSRMAARTAFTSPMSPTTNGAPRAASR